MQFAPGAFEQNQGLPFGSMGFIWDPGMGLVFFFFLSAQGSPCGFGAEYGPICEIPMVIIAFWYPNIKKTSPSCFFGFACGFFLKPQK